MNRKEQIRSSSNSKTSTAMPVEPTTSNFSMMTRVLQGRRRLEPATFVTAADQPTKPLSKIFRKDLVLQTSRRLHSSISSLRKNAINNTLPHIPSRESARALPTGTLLSFRPSLHKSLHQSLHLNHRESPLVSPLVSPHASPLEDPLKGLQKDPQKDPQKGQLMLQQMLQLPQLVLLLIQPLRQLPRLVLRLIQFLCQLPQLMLRLILLLRQLPQLVLRLIQLLRLWLPHQHQLLQPLRLWLLHQIQYLPLRYRKFQLCHRQLLGSQLRMGMERTKKTTTTQNIHTDCFVSVSSLECNYLDNNKPFIHKIK